MNEQRTTSCHEIIAELWEYLDQELTPENVARIGRHLDACQRCMRQFDFQRAFLALLNRHAESPVPPELRRDLFQRLLAEDAAAGR